MTTPVFTIGDIPVPAMAVGTMNFGTLVPRERAWACMDRALDTGARFWDTANNYAFWNGGTGDESETTIGDWLAAHGSTTREQVTIATKIGARPRTVGAGFDDMLGLAPGAIRSQVHDSLRRLRSDHIDILYAHIDDPATPLEETLTALSGLVDQGTVRAIAASNLTAPRLRQALAVGVDHPYRALQQRFTYLEPAPGTDLDLHILLDDQTSQLCDQHQITRLGYLPLLLGAYTRPDKALPAGYTLSRRAVSALDRVGADHHFDAGQTVLAWMVNRQSPVIPVVGVSRPDHVTAAWQATTTQLHPDQTRLLEASRHG